MNNQITCLRSQYRKYLEQECLSGRMTLDKAKEVAGEINLTMNHGLPSQVEVDVAIAKLGQKYPELVEAGGIAKEECELSEEKKQVDDKVLDLIAQGKLDEALQVVDGWKKEG